MSWWNNLFYVLGLVMSQLCLHWRRNRTFLQMSLGLGPVPFSRMPSLALIHARLLKWWRSGTLPAKAARVKRLPTPTPLGRIAGAGRSRGHVAAKSVRETEWGRALVSARARCGPLWQSHREYGSVSPLKVCQGDWARPASPSCLEWHQFLSRPVCDLPRIRELIGSWCLH